MNAENQIVTEKFKVTDVRSKSQMDLVIRLSMYSVFSLICFWFPLIIAYENRENIDERFAAAFFIVIPFIMCIALYSLILLRRLFLSLKQNKSQRRLILAILGVVVSLPSLIASILTIMYLLLMVFETNLD